LRAHELIWDGLHLTETVVVPHVDNTEFGEGCRKAGEQLKKAGYHTQWITDARALLIDGDEQQIL